MNKMDQIRDLQKIAVLLDSQFRLPLGFKIGLDGIVGLIPVIGDVLTTSMALYILGRSAMIGAPPSILLRMMINIVIDNVIGIIPVFGDVFDFFWRSNLSNLSLIENYVANPGRAVRRSRGVILCTLLIIFAFVASIAALIVAISMWVAGQIYSFVISGL
jgi:hypothetical protein